MTVLTASPKVTSVLFRGLDNLVLPFTEHVLEGMDSSAFDAGQVNITDKYYVKQIDGLGPPDRDVAIAATESGGKYQGNTPQDREIVVLIGLNPDWDAGETPKFLRDNLYTMINTGYDPKVSIQLIAGIFPIAETIGYVTKFETALFSKDPLVQITFTCLNPTFKALSQTTYLPAELDQKHPNVYNYGTAETGFKFAVKFTDDMSQWFIKFAEDQTIGMVFKKNFNAGDILSVSTIPGQRYVHWNKARGKVKNMMSILQSGSEFIALHPGKNNFVVPGGTKWQFNGKLSFTAEYWGA